MVVFLVAWALLFVIVVLGLLWAQKHAPEIDDTDHSEWLHGLKEPRPPKPYR